MASLFRYPSTLVSEENEGNQHIITFVAMKYNENRGTASPGSEVNLYITGDALKSTYGQVYADVAMGAIGGTVMQTQGAEAIYGAMESAAVGAAGKVTGGEGFDIAGLINDVSKVGGGGSSSILSTALAKGQLQSVRKGLGSKFPGVIEALDAKRGAVMNPHKALV